MPNSTKIINHQIKLQADDETAVAIRSHEFSDLHNPSKTNKMFASLRTRR